MPARGTDLNFGPSGMDSAVQDIYVPLLGCLHQIGFRPLLNAKDCVQDPEITGHTAVLHDASHPGATAESCPFDSAGRRASFSAV